MPGSAACNLNFWLQRGGSGLRQQPGELSRINSGVADQGVRLIVCTGSSTLEEVRCLHILKLHAFAVFTAGLWLLSSKPPPVRCCTWPLLHQSAGACLWLQLLRLFVENRVHRVYCVDHPESRHPQAVLTPTDVLSLIAASS